MFHARRLLRATASVAAAASLVGGSAACDPSPPRPSLVVTAQVDGPDSVPGDGVCASAVAGGECTLRAAFDEGNALGVADITVPPGDYMAGDPVSGFRGFTLSVVGDLRVNWGASHTFGMIGSIDVRPAGVLAVEGLRYIPSMTPLSNVLLVKVSGVVRLKDSFLTNATRATMPGATYVALDVAEGGGAVIDRSVLSGSTSAVRSEGLVLASDSTFLSNTTATLDVGGAGVTHLRATVLAGPRAGVSGGCTGTPPISAGYVHSDSPCLPAPGVGDAVGPAEVSFAGFSTLALAPTSPLIDAIPLGTAGCPVAATDFNGNPRAVDGDGDGVVACDIGAVEHQPVAP